MNRIYIYLLFTSFSLILSNNTISINQEHKINLKFENQAQIIGTINIGQIEHSIINENNENYIRLNIPNGYPSNIVGNPELPQINNLIEIPRGAITSIEIINDETIEFDLNNILPNTLIYPRQESVSKSDKQKAIQFWLFLKTNSINSIKNTS